MDKKACETGKPGRAAVEDARPASERAAEYAKYLCFCHYIIWPVERIFSALGSRLAKKS